jgi:hypothetical protein
MKRITRKSFKKFCDDNFGILYIKEKDYNFKLIPPLGLSSLLAPIGIKSTFCKYKDKNFTGITIKNKFRKIDVAVKIYGGK